MKQQEIEVPLKPSVEESSIESSAATPSHDDIAKLAYALWQQRGGGDGLAERDWFEAERQLLAPRAKGQAA